VSLHLYNTLTRRLEEFRPLDPKGKRVGIYVCGPTVYDVPHIGHARSAYVFDVLRRYLAFKGYQVKFVRNVTDVDDKIIEKARQETGDRRQETDLKAKCREVAERYLNTYHEAMDRLGIARPDVEPKATTRVVPDMTDCISKLLVSGAAYEAGGDVYFAVRKCEGYGRLSNRSLDELQAGARVEPGEHPGPPGTSTGAGKQDPLDFTLWKAAKPEEPSWPSPWGPGRPGWHIECSVMSTNELGDAFDIHGGGVDLVFPHHENEIAQAQGAGKPFARTWIHNGLLTVNGEKMSKSLGNFVTVEQALADAAGQADILKVFFLSTHYRSPIDYSTANLRAAEGRYRRLLHFCHAAMNQPAKVNEGKESDTIWLLDKQFQEALDDDLNTPRALASLDQLVGAGYQQEPNQWHFVANRIVSLARTTFGLLSEFVSVQLSAEDASQLQEREEARRRQDYVKADRIRERFKTKGLAVEDTPNGPVVLPSR
jgi:cysteinyl-tRNA synthetase